MTVERGAGWEMHLGDCLDVMPTLGHVEAVVTDPPFGISLITKTSDYRESGHFDNGASLQATVLYADRPDDIRALVAAFMPVALAMSDRALVFSGPAMLWAYPEPACVGSVFTPNGAGRCSWGFQCTHPVLFYGKDPYLARGKGARPNSLRTEQPNREELDHPCPKPVGWMMWAVERATFAGEAILDPFAGSGTTGVAALRLGRRFVGIEKEPAYFALACERLRAEEGGSTLKAQRAGQLPLLGGSK